MKCAVIGGGAAGLMAACRLAAAGIDVDVIEKQNRVGRKLLSTGNGRCNFTNDRATLEDYHGSKEHVKAVLAAFPPAAVRDAFEEMGIPGWADGEGRVYPMSNAAVAVLDGLRLTLGELGGNEVTQFEVVSVKKDKDFIITASDGRDVRADRVIICAGGMAAPKLGAGGGGYALLKALGHRIVPVFPAITPICTELSPIKGLKGQRVRCIVELSDRGKVLRTEKGEALFTDYGVSGICVMQLSRAVSGAAEPMLTINMAPDMDEKSFFARIGMLGARALEDILVGIVPRQVGINVIKHAGHKDLSMPASALTARQISVIYKTLTGFKLKVTGACGFDSAQVTAGGADMTQFVPGTMESRLVSGLYVAGEVCDVDGDCGGFNLNWAWASAMCAAQHIISGM